MSLKYLTILLLWENTANVQWCLLLNPFSLSCYVVHMYNDQKIIFGGSIKLTSQ